MIDHELKKLSDRFKITGMEHIEGDRRTLILITPKIPPEWVRGTFQTFLREQFHEIRWIEGIHPDKSAIVQTLLKQFGAIRCEIEQNSGIVTLNVIGNEQTLGADSPVWGAVQKQLELDEYVQEWKVLLNNDQIIHNNIRILRISRITPDHCITKDDITNLRIALGTCNTVEEFLEIA